MMRSVLFIVKTISNYDDLMSYVGLHIMPHLWIIYQVTDHCEVGIDKEGKLTSVILVASKALTAWNRQESKTLQGMRLHTGSKPYQCNFCAKKQKVSRK